MHVPRLLRHAILLLVASACGGCYNPEKWKFREEVLLNTGESIYVDRIALRNNVWPRFGGGGYQSVVNQWLAYPAGDAPWEAKWDGGSPISLGRMDGQLYLASVGQQPDPAYCRDHPTHYAVSFWKQTPAGWEPSEQHDAMLDALTANLLVDLEWGNNSSAKVPLLTNKEKTIRGQVTFAPAPSLRQALDKRLGASCKSVLGLGNEVPLPSNPSPTQAVSSSP